MVLRLTTTLKHNQVSTNEKALIKGGCHLSSRRSWSRNYNKTSSTRIPTSNKL